MIDYALRVCRAVIALPQRNQIRRDAVRISNDEVDHVNLITEVYKRHHNPTHAATHLVKVAAWLWVDPDTEIDSPSYSFERSNRQSSYGSYIMTKLKYDRRDNCMDGIWNAARYFDDEKALNQVIEFGLQTGLVCMVMAGVGLLGGAAGVVLGVAAIPAGGSGWFGLGVAISTSVGLVGAAYYAVDFLWQCADRLIERAACFSAKRSRSTNEMFDMVHIFNSTRGFPNLPPTSRSGRAAPFLTLPAPHSGSLQ